MNPTKQQIFALVTGDLEEKIDAKWPSPILPIDFNAMAAGAVKNHAKLIRNVPQFLQENIDIATLSSVSGLKLAEALNRDYAATRDKLFVRQFSTDFETVFGNFCDLTLGHIETLEAKWGAVGTTLRKEFLAVVSNESLQVDGLEEIVESIKRQFTDHFMSDERGEVTKFHQALHAALKLGLLDEVDFVPYDRNSDREHSAR